VHADAPAGEELPAGHASHRKAPETLENVPARQGRQGSVPVRLNEPAAHGVGVQALEPGGAVVPTGHGRQAALPGVAANVSAGQAVHADAPAAEKDPAGHASHSIAPDALENVPARQGRQGSAPVRLNEPGAHAIGVHAAEPGGAVVPRGHGRQAAIPESGWNVSAAQGVQLVEPRPAANDPGEQAVQLVAPGALEKVPTRHGAHSGSEPVGLNSPAGQSCARAAEEETRSVKSTAQTCGIGRTPFWGARVHRHARAQQLKKHVRMATVYAVSRARCSTLGPASG
jgi:hypothetical protein